MRLTPHRIKLTRRHQTFTKWDRNRPHLISYPCDKGWLKYPDDAKPLRLKHYQLPEFSNPIELAAWLEITLGELAWLTERFHDRQNVKSPHQEHYHYCWIPKTRGGRRLIEAPKSKLKVVQNKILRSILDKIPIHPAAHGFVSGRSPLTNASKHVGQAVVVKIDLQNFYPSVTYSRVVAIFRSIGYTREVAILLARLTTTSTPGRLLSKLPDATTFPYRKRHLPQGASTSPALANLSAYFVDLRLAGLARSFGCNYTRYADDMSFSGSKKFLQSLRVFLPLVRQVLQQNRFQLHRKKLRIERKNQRQTVTGVVVNERMNISRNEYDQLKAILWNCVKSGPAIQNREQCPDFQAVLRGRIAWVNSMNPNRGDKLKKLFDAIDWQR